MNLLLLLPFALLACSKPQPSATSPAPRAPVSQKPVRSAGPTPTAALPETQAPERTDFGALRLPLPGTPLEAVLARAPECKEQLLKDGQKARCDFHGTLADAPTPLAERTVWWRYWFFGEELVRAELSIMEADVDEVAAMRVVTGAEEVAQQLSDELGAGFALESPHPWAAVEAAERGWPLLLRRRIWRKDSVRVAWMVYGPPSHHPLVDMRIVVGEPNPDQAAPVQQMLLAVAGNDAAALRASLCEAPPKKAKRYAVAMRKAIRNVFGERIRADEFEFAFVGDASRGSVTASLGHQTLEAVEVASRDGAWCIAPSEARR